MRTTATVILSIAAFFLTCTNPIEDLLPSFETEYAALVVIDQCSPPELSTIGWQDTLYITASITIPDTADTEGYYMPRLSVYDSVSIVGYMYPPVDSQRIHLGHDIYALAFAMRPYWQHTLFDSTRVFRMHLCLHFYPSGSDQSVLSGKSAQLLFHKQAHDSGDCHAGPNLRVTHYVHSPDEYRGHVKEMRLAALDYVDTLAASEMPLYDGVDYSFNQCGRVTREVTYTRARDTNKVETYTYRYDGLLTSIVERDVQNGETDTTETYIAYDGSYTDVGTYRYTHGNDSLVDKVEIKYGRYTGLYFHDSLARLSRYEEWQDTGDSRTPVLDNYTTYEHGPDGTVLSEAHYEGDGELRNTYTYTFDAQGMVLGYTVTTPDSGGPRVDQSPITYRNYQVDAQGNWTYREAFSETLQEIHQIQTRAFEYW